MQRAVARGRARKPRGLARRIGVDEKAIAKRHKYLTIVSDLEKGTVEFLAEGRTKASFLSYVAPYTLAEGDEIEAIAMDMWSPFFETATASIPFVADKIVFDRYHRAEHFESLRTTNLKTARAWALKEMLRDLWNCPSREDATAFHRRWHAWASLARLPAVRKVAKMVKGHLHNILTYYAHGITNAVSEGIHSAIQTIKKRAGGYRNVENFKTAIYFHCGDLELYLARSSRH
jgi:transposase